MADAPVTQDLWTTGGDGGSEPTLRTVLILDLADSTALVDRLGDQRAAELIRRHDRLTRDLMRRHRGREIDKTDGFLLLFERPVQAVAFALEYQRRLRELADLEGTPMAARIGIHVGELVLWENSPEEIARGAKPMEVEGLAKPVAARLMAVALPGQVLLSGMAYGLAQRAESELRALGRVPLWKHHGNYRFKGVSDPTPVFEVGESGVAPFRPPPAGAKAHRIVPWWQRPAAIISEVFAVLAVIAAIGYATLKPEPGIAFAARDWVVVGELINRTGQQVLDDSLDLAFRQGLSQSRYVNVLSTLQVRDALARMKRDPVATQVDRSIGAELAQREQARALLLPSVADTGGSYRLSVEVVDPATQATVWVASENARRPEDLLPAMDKVIEGLREKLGESIKSVETDSVPLAQATTSNLEALRTFSIARKQYEQLKYDDARRLYERAIELDPEFAMAYAGVASTLLPIGRLDEGLASVRKAAALKTRLPPREAMYVDALLAASSDPRKGAEKWSDLASLYPDSGAGQNNAGLIYWQDLNDCAAALPLLKAATEGRDPLRFVSWHFKGYCELWSGEPVAAADSFRAALAMRPLPMTFGLADTLTYQERFSEVPAVIAQLPEGLPASFALEAKAREVTWLAYQGRLAQARTHAQDLASAARAASLEATESRAQLYTAAIDLNLGQAIDAGAYASAQLRSLSSDHSPHAASVHLALMALMVERQGQTIAAREWIGQIRANPSQRGNPSLDALLLALDARMSPSAAAGLALIPATPAPSERFQVRWASAELAERSGNPERALADLEWLAANRSRAFAEYDDYFAAQVLNVLDVNQALLRQIKLEPDPQKAARLRQALKSRWADADPSLKALLLETEPAP